MKIYCSFMLVKWPVKNIDPWDATFIWNGDAHNADSRTSQEEQLIRQRSFVLSLQYIIFVLPPLALWHERLPAVLIQYENQQKKVGTNIIISCQIKIYFKKNTFCTLTSVTYSQSKAWFILIVQYYSKWSPSKLLKIGTLWWCSKYFLLALPHPEKKFKKQGKEK